MNKGWMEGGRDGRKEGRKEEGKEERRGGGMEGKGGKDRIEGRRIDRKKRGKIKSREENKE